MPGPFSAENVPNAEELHVLRAVYPGLDTFPGLWDLYLLERPDLAAPPSFANPLLALDAAGKLLSEPARGHFACDSAAHVLPFFEAAFEGDDRPAHVLRRARLFLEGTINARQLDRASRELAGLGELSVSGPLLAAGAVVLAVLAVAEGVKTSVSLWRVLGAAGRAAQEAGKLSAPLPVGVRLTTQDKQAIQNAAGTRALQAELAWQREALREYLCPASE